MDFFHSADPYCILFLNDHEREAFSTSIVKNCTAPVYNEHFQFALDGSNKFLVITVLDSDELTRDDVIGFVYIDLRKLPTGVTVDEWYL